MAYDRRQGDYSVPDPGMGPIDHATEIGRVYVPVGEARGFAALDPARAAALSAWTSELIPAAGPMPAAGDVGAAEYIDATVLAAGRLRGLLRRGLRQLDEIAGGRAGRPFAECDAETRASILREFEAADTSGLFGLVRDLTYEAYYAHPRILDLLASATGWRSGVAATGSALPDFDEGLLARVRRAPRYRRG
jgi:gluconate 2-dehydrogenase subunit 3-like protein